MNSLLPELYSSHTSISFPSSNNSTSEMENNEVNVDGHIKKERKEKFKSCSYKCQFCDKSFPRLGYLKKHEQVSELFKCNVIIVEESKRTGHISIAIIKVTSINLSLLFYYDDARAVRDGKLQQPIKILRWKSLCSYFYFNPSMITVDVNPLINETALVGGIQSEVSFTNVLFWSHEKFY